MKRQKNTAEFRVEAIKLVTEHGCCKRQQNDWRYPASSRQNISLPRKTDSLNRSFISSSGKMHSLRDEINLLPSKIDLLCKNFISCAGKCICS
jgi:hypothetical protein